VTATSQLGPALGQFPSAVVTGTDPDGYPVSFRCRPVKDPSGVLRIEVPAWTGLVPGPASLMAHIHDEQVWNQRSFVSKGTIEVTGDGLVFRPATFAWTMGGSALDTLRQLRKFRRTAVRYIERRGMAWPAVPWDAIKAAKKATPH